MPGLNATHSDTGQLPGGSPTQLRLLETDMAAVLDLLQGLSSDGAAELNAENATAVRELCEQQVEAAALWGQAVDAGVSFVALAAALAEQMRASTPETSQHAASVYAMLLRLPDSE